MEHSGSGAAVEAATDGAVAVAVHAAVGEISIVGVSVTGTGVSVVTVMLCVAGGAPHPANIANNSMLFSKIRKRKRF